MIIMLIYDLYTVIRKSPDVEIFGNGINFGLKIELKPANRVIKKILPLK